jgi:predicted amidophosphoribosyltransferase
MSIDIPFLRQHVVNEWENDNLWVLPYHTKRSGTADGVSEFIWQFKSGAREALYAAVQLLSEAIEEHEDALRAQYDCSIIASAPSSRQGFPKPLPENVCTELAERHPWLAHAPRLLHRTQTVRQAHLCRPGERPNFGTHIQTIACGAQYNLDGRGVLLFDDVLTTGGTSQACAAILRQKPNCGNVVGLFLGRTQR